MSYEPVAAKPKLSASSDRTAQKRQPGFRDQPQHPVTSDGRYFVVRGQLWRMPDPNLSPAKKSTLVSELMKARSAVRLAKLAGDQGEEAAANRAVNVVKRELGERGPVWWPDGAPDLNRQAVKNTPYAKWYSGLRASRRARRRLKALRTPDPPVRASHKCYDERLSPPPFATYDHDWFYRAPVPCK
jgi:hypothetical protein